MSRSRTTSPRRFAFLAACTLAVFSLVFGSGREVGGQEATTPILQIDLSYLRLDTEHDLVQRLDEESLAANVIKNQYVLAGAGAATVFRRFSVITVGEEEAMVQLGRRVTVITGRLLAPNANAPVRQITQDRDVGTMVHMVPILAGDKVVLELNFESSSIGSVGGAGGTPETKTATIQVSAAVDLDVPTIVYDVTEGGDSKDRIVCVVVVSKKGELKEGLAVSRRGTRSGFGGAIRGGAPAGATGRAATGRAATGRPAASRAGLRPGAVAAGALAPRLPGASAPPIPVQPIPVQPNSGNTEERLQAYTKSYFERNDANGDGKLQFTEVRGERTRAYDKDGDEAVSQEEFLDAILKR
jgi:hypothetical protein